MDRPEPSTRRPRIGIVCLSAIPDDPRVRRQGDLFSEKGWEVLAFGLPGALSSPPGWFYKPLGGSGATEAPAPLVAAASALPPLVTSAAPAPVPMPGRGSGLIRKAPAPLQPSLRFAAAMARPVFAVARKTVRRLRRLWDVSRVVVDPAHAAATYWSLNDRFAQLLELAQPYQADIWLANDWTAMPIVRRLAEEQGVPYAYDTHELAVDEYAERWRWRLLQRPVIAAIERQGIAGAVVTSCVSQGIADRLHELYRLREKPLLIRNMPRYEPHAQRPCGETIEVLYHGVVSPGRGLEACIESVAQWRGEFRLTIRGPASAAYRESLAARVKAAGVTGRVVLAPPVPMIELVREAAHFDVGLFALPGHSQQNVHVLPNKFFEYTMAGLALCVSDLPEMSALLRQYELGRLIPEVTPAAIATAINGFDRATIEACKARALEAAKALNWEAEADRFFDAIDEAVRRAAEPAQAAG